MSTLPMEINPIASLQTYGDDSDEGNEEDNETTEEINENVDSAETAAIDDENTEMTASMEVVQEPFNENVLIEECEQNIEEGLWDYCYWCFYRFTSPEEYKEHCSGIAHKQKMSRRYGAYIINNKKEELSELDKIFRESFKDGKVDPPIFGLNDLYCDLCKITCTGPANFERHIMGNRHHKNVMLDHLGVSSFDVITQYVRKKNKKNRKKGNRASWLETKLEDWKMPLIGLQYITEIQKEDKSVEPRYYCELCDSKSDPRVLMTHLTGVKHRLKYLKACHFDKVPDTVSTATKKAAAAPILEEIAAEVEKVEGRQQIKVKIEPELNLSSARKRGGNFGGGGNFKRARTDSGSKFERRGGRGGGGRGGGRGGRGGGRGGRGGGRGGGDWKKFDDRGRDRSRDRDRGRKDSVGRDRDRSFRDNRDSRGNERDYRGKDRERDSRKPDYRDDRKRSEDSRNSSRDATQGRRHFQENVATSQRPAGTLSTAAQSWLGQESGTSAQSDFRYEAYKQEPSRNVAYDNSFSPSRYSQLYQTAVSTSQTPARPAMPPPGTLPPTTQYLQSSGYGLGLTGYLNQK